MRQVHPDARGQWALNPSNANFTHFDPTFTERRLFALHKRPTTTLVIQQSEFAITGPAFENRFETEHIFLSDLIPTLARTLCHKLNVGFML